MTIGKLVFCSGVALLIATILLIVVFVIKKPKYIPDALRLDDKGKTETLLNGYPTDRLTRRYKTVNSVTTTQVKRSTGDNETLGVGNSLIESTEPLMVNPAQYLEETEQLEKKSEMPTAKDKEDLIQYQGSSLEGIHQDSKGNMQLTEALFEETNKSNQKTESLLDNTDMGEGKNDLGTEALFQERESTEE